MRTSREETSFPYKKNYSSSIVFKKQKIILQLQEAVSLQGKVRGEKHRSKHRVDLSRRSSECSELRPGIWNPRVYHQRNKYFKDDFYCPHPVLLRETEHT